MPLLFLAVVAAQAAAAPEGQPQPARPRSDLARFVSGADYPAEALLAEEEGTVGFQLTVGPDGRVTDCVITQSSFSQLLDDATCRLMRRRAHFVPARDWAGRPSVGVVSASIDWQIAEAPKPEADEPVFEDSTRRGMLPPLILPPSPLGLPEPPASPPEIPR